MKLLRYLGSGRAGTAWLFSCVAVGGVFMLSALLPFIPLTVYSIRVVPEKVCPGGAVEVSVDRDWRLPNALFGIRYVVIESRWRNVVTGETYPVTEMTGEPDLRIPSGEVRSDLVRVAVRETGTYELDTRYVVFGRAVALPAQQSIPDSPDAFLASEGRVRVVPCNPYSPTGYIPSGHTPSGHTPSGVSTNYSSYHYGVATGSGGDSHGG